MNLTEPQIEAVFEWIDLNVDRKTAIRFVKDFYKPVLSSSNEAAELIRKYNESASAVWPVNVPIVDFELERVQRVRRINEARERYPKGTKIKMPHGKIVEVIGINQLTTGRWIYAACKDGDRIEDVLIYHQVNDLDVYWAEIVTDKPHEVPFCQTAKSKTIVDKTQGEFTSKAIPKHLITAFFEKSTNSEIMNAIQSERIELSDWIKWMKGNSTDKPWRPALDIDLSLVDESERENLEQYKRSTLIESYSYPGVRLYVDSIEDYGQKNKTITAKCYNPAIGDVTAVIAHRNFNGTGNTYWATIVKEK